MKRVLILLFAFILLLSGCSLQQSKKMKAPVDFYYLQPDFESAKYSSLLWTQQRESTGFSGTEELLSAYLQGPGEEGGVSPFPAGTELISYTCKNDVAYLTLSNELKQISGYELTLACGCLAKTVFGILDIQAVQIGVKDGAIRGDELYIVLRENDLLFLDSSITSKN